MDGTQRIAAAFAGSGKRAALMPYLMGGFPDHETSLRIGEAYADGGADLVELGVPFSDPLADGPVIHAAGTRALAAGATVDRVLELAARLSERLPVVVMTYANLVLARTPDGFADSLRDAGASGLIVPDLPLEEAPAVLGACDARGLALVPLVAPTTPDDRLAAIGERARGFLYTVSVAGTTGERRSAQDGGVGVLGRGALARRPGHRDRVEEAAGALADRREALVGRGRRHERDEGDAARVAGAEHRVRLLEREVGHDQPARARARERIDEPVGGPREHEVRVGHEDDREALRQPAGQLEHRVDGRARLERGGAGGVDDGAVGERVGERHPELDEVGAAVGVGLADAQRRLEVGKPAHEVRHQGRPLAGSGEGARDPLDPVHRACNLAAAAIAGSRADRPRWSV